MNDRAVGAADRIESKVLRDLERMYPGAISPLIEKHKTTLEKLEKLENDGAYGRARVLIRKSHLVDDIAEAIASVGVKAARLIREEMRGVKEVASHDDPEETG